MSAPTESLPESPPASGLTSERFPLLLFFDGECAFCDRWMNRVRAADRGRRMRFGTKQGLTFQRLALAHPELTQVESIVLAKRRADGGDDFLVRSAAIREALAGLPEFRFFGTVLRVVPTPIANLGYRIFSKIRTPLFGRLDRCRVPLEEEKDLFVA